MKKLFLTMVLTSILFNPVLGQSVRKYVFQYREKIIFDYSGLLEKTKGNFTSTESNWSGSFLLNGYEEEKSNFEFIVSKTGEPNTNSGVLPPAYTTLVSVHKNSPDEQVAKICYQAYPGKDADVLVRNLLTSIQYFKLKPFLTAHNTNESFVDGRFDVAYRSMAGPVNDKGNIILQKVKTSSFNPGSKNLVRIIIDSFYCRIHYNSADSVFNELTLSEYKHQKLGDRILAYVYSEVKIRRQDNFTPGISKRDISFQTGEVCTDVLNSLSRKERKSQIAANVLKNISVTELANELRSDSIFDPVGQRELNSRLRAALFLQPGIFDEIKKVLDTCERTGQRFSLLMSIMLGAESIPVQQYLAEFIMKHSHDYDILKSILPPMGVMTYLVDSSLLTSLTALLNSGDRDISFLAGLALSNMSNQLKYDDGHRAGQVNNILWLHFQRSTSDRDQQLQYLKEIGNAGDEKRIDFLIPFMQSKDEELKATAILAFRFIYLARADSILAIEMIRNAADRVFIEKLTEVILLRFPSTIIRAGIYRMLREEKISPQAKRQLIEYLRYYSDELPLLSDELIGISTFDKELDTLLDQLRSQKEWYSKL